MRTGTAAAAALALVGCGSQPPDADAPRDGDDDEVSGSLIDDEGFETAPEVAFPAPATTRFGGGHLLCTEHHFEISPEVAMVLGYDAEGDRAALEATQVREARISADGDSTVVHYRGRIARILCENGQAVEFGQPLFIIE